MVKISIVILNYKQKELTLCCLKFVLLQTFQDFEIIIVDNNSQDGSFELFKKIECNKIKVIKTKQNVGYCGGNNFGVLHSDKSSEYILILNNDTIIQKNLVEELFLALKSLKSIGASTVLISNRGEEKKVLKMLKDKESHISNIFMEGISIKYKQYSNPNYYPIFYPSGACFMYKKKIVNAPFDSDYFAYGDEIYFGHVIRRAGYKVVLCYNTGLLHENSVVKKSSNRSVQKYLDYLGRRNKLYNQILFLENKTLLKLLPLIIIYNLFETIYDIKNFNIRFKVYMHIFFNIKILLNKKKKLKNINNDKEFLKIFSYKFASEEYINNKLLKKIVKILNSISYYYCKLIGLKLNGGI